MDLHELRTDLPVTRDSIYMNTGWAGPTSLRVLARIRQTLEEEASLGPASARGLAFVRQVAEDARQALAGFIGADPEEVLLTHSTTEGVNIVLHGLPWRAGDELLICDLEHPAITGPAQVLAERKGVRVINAIILPAASSSEILAAIKGSITSQTKLVALSHIQFTCGLRMPMKEIATLVHEAGIPLLVDGAQSAGHIVLEMHDLGVDFYALSGQKWLMGLVGTGALYVRKDRLSALEPLLSTNTLEASRTMERPPLAPFAIASHNPGLIAGLAESVRIAQECSPQYTEAYTRRLAATLSEGMDGVPGCVILSPRAVEASCGLSCISLQGWAPSELVSTLQERFAIVARSVHHPDGVRFSTAIFNTTEEVARVVKSLTVLAADKPAAT